MILDRVLTPSESQEVLSQLRPLLTLERFHARGIVQSPGAIRQCHIEVDRPAEEWFVAFEDGRSHEFRGGVATHGDEPGRPGASVTDSLIDPVTLAYPERILVWGQRPAAERPILLQRIGRRSLLVTFEHGADPSMRGTMVIDTELGVVTRFLRFGFPAVLLVDIEPGLPVQRRVPDRFPPLEVIQPDY